MHVRPITSAMSRCSVSIYHFALVQVVPRLTTSPRHSERPRLTFPTAFRRSAAPKENAAHRRGISLYTSIFKLGLSWDYIKKAGKNTRFCLLFWLGWLDLNQRMTESESVALPLGDTPIICLLNYYIKQIRKLQAFLSVFLFFPLRGFLKKIL